MLHIETYTYWPSQHNIFLISTMCSVLPLQGLFCVLTQPMRDDVTVLSGLSLAGCMYRKIPAIVTGPDITSSILHEAGNIAMAMQSHDHIGQLGCPMPPIDWKGTSEGFGYRHGQWEKVSHSNNSSHWLSPHWEWSVHQKQIHNPVYPLFLTHSGCQMEFCFTSIKIAIFWFQFNWKVSSGVQLTVIKSCFK